MPSRNTPSCLCPALAALVLAFAASAQPRQALSSWWWRAVERQAGHYRIKRDLPAEEAQWLSGHLNLLYDEFSARLAALPARAPAPLNVMLFADRRDYVETLRRRFNVAAEGTGGIFFVNPSGSALAMWTGGLPRRRVLHVLQHEAFHQFAYSRFGGDLPPWANEGLAELFASAVLVDGRLVVGQSSEHVVQRVKSSIELETHVPFALMLSATNREWSDAVREEDAAVLYPQAWSMVHFLIYGEDGRYLQRFESYLRLVNAGYPSKDSFLRAFATDDIEAFEGAWKAYALAAEPSPFLTAVDRIEYLAEGALELSERGIIPGSLEDLAEALAAAGFSYVLRQHGVEIELEPDARMFAIPPTGASRQGGREPVFVVSRAKPYELPRRERELEERHPTPPAIETSFLRPRNLAVRWIRSPDGAAFTYDIVVK